VKLSSSHFYFVISGTLSLTTRNGPVFMFTKVDKKGANSRVGRDAKADAIGIEYRAKRKVRRTALTMDSASFSLLFYNRRSERRKSCC
jgi:hypothetical protein